MASIVGTYPMQKATVLNTVQSLSGVPVPDGLVDRSTIVLQQDVSQPLFLANPVRRYILIYNPSVPQVQLALIPPLIGTQPIAVWGVSTNLIVGPGEAWFFATDQGLGTVFQGGMSLVGLTPGCPLFAWEAPV